MSPVFHASARHWLLGLTLAVAGVALNRLLAPHLSPLKLAIGLALAGDVIALTGLAVIVAGIRRRLARAEAALADSPKP